MSSAVEVMRRVGADGRVEFWLISAKPRRVARVRFPSRKYRMRGAPGTAMNRSQFARAVGKDRTTVWRWEQRGWLHPAGSVGVRPFFVRDQIDEWETIEMVRSARGMRVIRELVARRGRHA